MGVHRRNLVLLVALDRGDPISPYLFVLYVERIAQAIEKSSREQHSNADSLSLSLVGLFFFCG